MNANARPPAPKRSTVRIIQPRSPPLGAALLGDLAWVEISRSLKLSERELEIVRNVFDNHTETTIATNLGISGHTIHSHLNRVFRKMGVTTRTQLVLRVMQELLTLTKVHGSSLPPICCNHGSRRCPIKGKVSA